MSISDLWTVAVWALVLIIFFGVIYAAAKSDRPGSTLGEFLLSTSGVEGLAIWCVWKLIQKADAWRRELDEEDNARCD